MKDGSRDVYIALRRQFQPGFNRWRRTYRPNPGEGKWRRMTEGDTSYIPGETDWLRQPTGAWETYTHLVRHSSMYEVWVT